MSANNCKVRELGSNPNNNRRATQKKKINRNRIIFIGAGSFIVFFIIFMAVASMMTPKIDISGQTNVDESSLSEMSSNDFKGRIDPSLKEIEAKESSGGYDISSRRSTVATTAAGSIQQPVTTTAKTVQTINPTQEEQIINDSLQTESLMPTVDQQTEAPVIKRTEVRRSSQAVQVQQVQPTPPRPAAPLVLRDRIRPSSSSSYSDSSSDSAQ